MDSVPVNVISIDDAGDALVWCSSEETETNLGVLQASAKILSMASPALEAMLDPAKGFRESQTDGGGKKCLRLSADDLAIIITVMKIIHHKTRGLPEEVTPEFLYNLASFCDCYQFQESVAPWVRIWVYNQQPTKKQLDTDCWLWIWVAKVFEITKLLEECTKTAIWHTKRKEPMVFSFKEKKLHPALTGFVQGGIWNHRERFMTRLTAASDAKVAEYQDCMSRGITRCKVGEASKECDIAQLGSLFSLKLSLGYPKPNPDHLSLMEVCEIYRNVVGLGRLVTFHKWGVSGNQGNHALCNLSGEFKRLAEEVGR